MMKHELEAMMAIIPDEIKADVYYRIKKMVGAIIDEIVIDVEKHEYRHSTQSSMDRIGTMMSIIEIAAKDMNVNANMLWSPKRNAEYVQMRQMLMWLFRTQYPQLPLRMIGDMFKRDHATILHAMRQVEGAISTDPVFRGVLKNLIDLIHQHDFDMSNALFIFEKLTKKALVK